MKQEIAVSRLNPTTWPLSFKVPLLVAVLMFAVSAAVTNRVLSRLEDSQEQNLQQLASAYLDGLSASLIPSVSRADVWEVFDTLDRSRERYKGLNVRWTIVTNTDGKILASRRNGFPLVTGHLAAHPESLYRLPPTNLR